MIACFNEVKVVDFSVFYVLLNTKVKTSDQ